MVASENYIYSFIIESVKTDAEAKPKVVFKTDINLAEISFSICSFASSTQSNKQTLLQPIVFCAAIVTVQTGTVPHVTHRDFSRCIKMQTTTQCEQDSGIANGQHRHRGAILLTQLGKSIGPLPDFLVCSIFVTLTCLRSSNKFLH